MEKSINEQFQEFIENNMFKIYEYCKLQNKTIFNPTEIMFDCLKDEWKIFINSKRMIIYWSNLNYEANLPLFYINFKASSWEHQNINIIIK